MCASCLNRYLSEVCISGSFFFDSKSMGHFTFLVCLIGSIHRILYCRLRGQMPLVDSCSFDRCVLCAFLSCHPERTVRQLYYRDRKRPILADQHSEGGYTLEPFFSVHVLVAHSAELVTLTSNRSITIKIFMLPPKNRTMKAVTYRPFMRPEIWRCQGDNVSTKVVHCV